MIRLTISHQKLTDGSYVFNGDLHSVDVVSPVATVRMPEQINFVTQEDARKFADDFLNLFLHRTSTAAEVKYDY